jgi:hypothetical protein
MAGDGLVAGWDDSIFGNLPPPRQPWPPFDPNAAPPQQLPGSPPRPQPPPSQGLSQDLFPVHPLEVLAGLQHLYAQGMGDAAGYLAGHTPLDFMGAPPQPAGVQQSAQGFGRDITGIIDKPGEHISSPGGATHALDPSLAIFAGPLAKTADLQALQTAQTMAKQGHDAESIWNKTGWFQGGDQKWRSEIPDTTATVKSQRNSTAGDIVNHPDLFAAYPDLAKTEMRTNIGGVGTSGGYSPGGWPEGMSEPDIKSAVEAATGRPAEDMFSSPRDIWRPPEQINANAQTMSDLRTTSLHELQHAVQEREGFAPGGSPNDFLDQFGGDYQPAFRKYQQLPGEVEARNVEARSGMTPDQLRENPPWLTSDVSEMLRQPDASLTRLRGGQAEKVTAPSILSRANPTSDDINAIMQSVARTKATPWPTAQNPIFDQSLEAAQRTSDVVPQISRAADIPRPAPGQALPEKGRVQQIMDARGPISDRIASDLQPMVDRNDPMLHFYSTAPITDQMQKQGLLSPDEANQFMRDWAGQGAATSPRTATPTNMRNSSLLQYRRAIGSPLDRPTWEAEGNAPGFPMMGMHVDLADQFAKGTENINTNPKPTLFRDAWSGNTSDVVADTHNIRATLRAYDQDNPGQLHPSWFSSPQAYQDYKANGGFGQGPLDVGAIKDTLGDATLKGVRKQVEYGPMSDPWRDVGQKLGISPGQAQSGGWFNYGPQTGLRSPPKTLPMLLNDQIEHTSRVLGIPQEKVLDWWANKKIPLAENAVRGVGPQTNIG